MNKSIYSNMFNFAKTNNFLSTEDLLTDFQKNGKPLTESDVNAIVGVMCDDFKLFIDEKSKLAGENSPGMEYIKILRQSDWELILSHVLNATLNNYSIEEIISNASPCEYKYREYNCSLCHLCKGLLTNEGLDIREFRFFVSLSLVIVLFSKKIVSSSSNSNHDKYLGDIFSVVDDMFYFNIDKSKFERKMLLYHLKNAVTHGRIVFDGS